MTTSATQEGVQVEDATSTTETTQTTETTHTEPQLSDREKVMQQIAEQNEARMIAEHKEQGIVIEGATQADQVAAQLDADKPTVLDAGLDKIMVKQVIDGEERLVSVADLNRDAQKHGAADKRLEEAARDRREAARLLAEAQASATTVLPTGNDTRQASKDSTTQAQVSTDDEVKGLRKELTDALFEGDAEKVLEALDKLGVGRPQMVPTQTDPSELAAQLAPVLRQQLSAESALEKFASDYPDIVSDPHLDSMTAGFIQEQMKDGKSFTEALEPAAKKTRDWLATKTGTTNQTASTMDRTQKLERKEGIDNVQSLNTKATTAEEPVQSASDVIAEMRKSRGLA